MVAPVLFCTGIHKDRKKGEGSHVWKSNEQGGEVVHHHSAGDGIGMYRSNDVDRRHLDSAFDKY